jgi:hypothetical protein
MRFVILLLLLVIVYQLYGIKLVLSPTVAAGSSPAAANNIPVITISSPSASNSNSAPILTIP